MRARLVVSGAALFTLGALLASPAILAQSSRYEIQDLGTLSGAEAMARAINEAGQVAGAAATNAGVMHAFRFSDGVGMIDLGSLGGPSQGLGINADGHVTGVTDLPSGAFHAFRVRAGGMEDLGTLSGDFSVGRAINRLDQVAGYTQVPGGFAFHAFRYTDGVGMQDLGTLGGSTSIGAAINDRGQVAGYSNTVRNGAIHAFRFTDGVPLLDLGHLGGDRSLGFAVNARGQVAGWSWNGTRQARAFRWTEGSGMQDLGTLGGTSSAAEGMNDAGHVVGSSATAAGAAHAFLFTDEDGMVDLNLLVDASSGWTLQAATAINNAGQIAGYGLLNGQTRAFRLKPAGDSEPPSLDLPADFAVEAQGPDGAAASYSASAHDNVDGAMTPTCAPASGSMFPLGMTRVECSATDRAGNEARGRFDVMVQDTTPPSIAPHPDMTVEASSPKGASVSYSSPATFDLVDGAGVATCSPASGGMFPLGDTLVHCAATDAHGNAAAPTSFVVHVVDTTAPGLSLAASPAVLWPPRHQMVPVSVRASASDAVDPSPACAILSVTSNEPGEGDMYVRGPLTAELRAERLGSGAGRRYTILVGCSDASGNRSQRQVWVDVPHDNGK